MLQTLKWYVERFPAMLRAIGLCCAIGGICRLPQGLCFTGHDYGDTIGRAAMAMPHSSAPKCQSHDTGGKPQCTPANQYCATPTSAPPADSVTTPSDPPKAKRLKVVRFPQNPIIRPEMLPAGDGGNINGPSLIRVPEWVSSPLGRYYLYFAHHNGRYIRLAVADRLEGPWKIHPPGVLRLSEAPGCKGHIASPDVIVVPELKQIRMYFHCLARQAEGQMTFVATSSDGLNFKADDKPLCPFYFRAFRYEGMWYGMSKGGLLWRSRDGLRDFEEGIDPMPGAAGRDKPNYNKPGVRHVAVHRVGQTLWVYYSNIGDAPERILRCAISLKGDWRTWRAGPPEEVLRPEFEYEGADLPVKRSLAGAAHGREHALRDPAIHVENGCTYLLYSVAGESGIAIAELHEEHGQQQ